MFDDEERREIVMLRDDGENKKWFVVVLFHFDTDHYRILRALLTCEPAAVDS